MVAGASTASLLALEVVDVTPYLSSIAEIARLIGGLGLVTIALAGLKRFVEKRRWRRFRQLAQQFATESFEQGIADQRPPRQYNDDDWRSLAEEMLTDVGMTPTEVTQILSTAVIVLQSRYQERAHVRRKPR